MTHRAIAARYARALLDVSLKEGDPRAVERDLAAFVELLVGHRELYQALTNPAVPIQKKQAVVNTLKDRVGVLPIVDRTLALLASRDRIALLPDLLKNY